MLVVSVDGVEVDVEVDGWIGSVDVGGVVVGGMAKLTAGVRVEVEVPGRMADGRTVGAGGGTVGGSGAGVVVVDGGTGTGPGVIEVDGAEAGVDVGAKVG